MRDRAAARDEPSGRGPVAETARVGERRPAPEHGARRGDVGAGVEQGIEDVDVVAAGGPVQRRLGVGVEAAGRTRVGAGGHDAPHDLGPVREVTRPVRRRVEQRAVAALVAEARRRQPRVGDEQAIERVEIAGLDGGRRLEDDRVVRRDERGRARQSPMRSKFGARRSSSDTAPSRASGPPDGRPRRLVGLEQRRAQAEPAVRVDEPLGVGERLRRHVGGEVGDVGAARCRGGRRARRPAGRARGAAPRRRRSCATTTAGRAPRRCRSGGAGSTSCRARR